VIWFLLVPAIILGYLVVAFIVSVILYRIEDKYFSKDEEWGSDRALKDSIGFGLLWPATAFLALTVGLGCLIYLIVKGVRAIGRNPFRLWQRALIRLNAVLP
jgi:hypothetical protein